MLSLDFSSLPEAIRFRLNQCYPIRATFGLAFPYFFWIRLQFETVLSPFSVQHFLKLHSVARKVYIPYNFEWRTKRLLKGAVQKPSFHAGPLSWSNWNLDMLVFVKRRKPENQEKNSRSKASTNNKLNPHMTPRQNRTRTNLVPRPREKALGMSSPASATSLLERPLVQKMV